MEGLFFYWFSWILWVIVTFLMQRGKSRNTYAIWILVTIIVSNFYLSIDNIEISFSYLFILFGAFLVLSTLQQKGLQIFSAFTIMIGYTSVLIWEISAPVWVFMPRLILIPMICVGLTVMISSNFINRIVLNTIGQCGGEFLYSLLLSNYSIHHTIGDFLFLDVLLVSLIVIVSIEVIQKGKERSLIYITNLMKRV